MKCFWMLSCGLEPLANTNPGNPEERGIEEDPPQPRSPSARGSPAEASCSWTQGSSLAASTQVRLPGAHHSV